MQEDRKKLISERREREREAEALRAELAAVRSASRDTIQWILATFWAISWADFGGIFIRVELNMDCNLHRGTGCLGEECVSMSRPETGPAM